MKKVLIVVLILGIVVCGFLYLQGPQKSAEVENILPAKPVFFLRVADLSGKIDRFAQTSLWKGITGIDYVPILKAAKVNEDDITAWKKIFTQLMAPENADLLKKFFGKEVSLAVYPTSFDELSAQAVVEFTSNIYVVTRLKPDMQFMEFFSGFFSRFQKTITTQTMTYKKHKITFVVTSDGIKLGYVRIKDFLVLGVGDRAARAAIDTWTDSKSISLNKDAEYLRAKASFLDKSDTSGYLNVALIADSMKSQMLKFASQQDPQRAELIKKQFENSFQYTQGFKSVGFSSLWQSSITSKMDVHYNTEEIDSGVRSLYQCPPSENKTLSFVPRSTIGYQWNTCYDFKFYWEKTKKDMVQSAALNPDAPSLQEQITAVEKQINLNIEQDVLPALGNEVGGFLTDIGIANAFPMPKVAIFLSVTDQAKAEKIITTLLSKQPLMQPQVETYKEMGIHFLSVPLVQGLEPSYSFIGNYLIVGTSRDPIKEAIDVFKNSAASITAKPGFQEAGQGLLEKNNSIFYLQFDEFVAKLQGVADWTQKWIDTENAKREAFKAGSEKRITDLKSTITQNEKTLTDLNTQLKTINEQIKQATTAPAPVPPAAPDAGSTAPATTAPSTAPMPVQNEVNYIEKRKTMEEKIVALQKDIQANKDKIKELEQTVKSYAVQANDIQERKIVVEYLIRPALKILSSIKSLGTRMLFKDNLIETYFYLKVE